MSWIDTCSEAGSRIYSDYMSYRATMAKYRQEDKDREQAEENMKLNVTCIKEAHELSKLTGKTVEPTDLYKRSW